MSQTLPIAIADLELTLADNVFEGDLTATLSESTDEDGVTLPTGLYGLTIDKDLRSKKEYILCTVTGTAITAVQSLTKQGANTGTGFLKDHRAGAKVTLTDWILLKRMLNNLNGTTGFDSGTHLGYDGAPTGLTGNEFATVNYVLSVVSGGTVTFDQQVLTNQTLGETISVNDVVYFKGADSRWWKADADLTATFDELELGISKTAGAAAASATIARSGPVSGFVGLTSGSKYYLSNTAGGISTSAGTNSVYIGTALSTTVLLLDSRAAEMPTAGEKDALAGTAGTPSSSNKYITQDGMADGSSSPSQTTQNATVALGQADTSGLNNKVAQSFVAVESILKSVSLYKSANTGTFTGTVTVSIQADSSGSPSGVALATKTITNALYSAYTVGDFAVLFSSELAITPGSTYWIVVETSTADSANRPNLGTNSAGGYASGAVKARNATDGWFSVPTIDLYFKVGEGFSTKALAGDSSGFIPAAARKTSIKVGVFTGAASFVHGLGKVPSYIELTRADASTVQGGMSVGWYDVANNAYAVTAFNYNEGTAATSVSDTTGVLYPLAANGNLGTVITVTAIDENVVILSASTTGAYKVIG